MVLRFHKKRIWICVLFVFFLVQNAILEYTSGVIERIVGYSDEIVECLLIMLIILRIATHKVKILKYEYFLIIFFAVFVAMGLISNFVQPLQSLFLSLSDMLVCCRFVVFYFAARLLLFDYCDNEQLLLDFNKIAHFFAVLCFVLTIHDLFFAPWFETGDFRYFAYSTKLFFSQPSFLAVACVICMIVNIASYDITDDKVIRRRNTISIFMLSFVMIMTFRSKAIAAVVCILFLYILLVRLNVQSKTVLFGGGTILALIIGWDQFSYYYATNSETVLRARLHIDAVQLAGENFPLGTGFATFGSSIAAENFSPLYTNLGYQDLHGGDSVGSNFLSDTFWPTVIAQTGFIGTIAFLAVIICFVYIAFTAKCKGSYMLWALLSLLVYEVISSTSEPAFFNPSVVSMFMVFGICINIVHNNEDEIAAYKIAERKRLCKNKEMSS